MSPVYEKGGGKSLLWNDFDVWRRVCFHCNKRHNNQYRMRIASMIYWTSGRLEQAIKMTAKWKRLNLPNESASVDRCSDSILPSLLYASTQISSGIWWGKMSRFTWALLPFVSLLWFRPLLMKEFTSQRNSATSCFLGHSLSFCVLKCF